MNLMLLSDSMLRFLYPWLLFIITTWSQVETWFCVENWSGENFRADDLTSGNWELKSREDRKQTFDLRVGFLFPNEAEWFPNRCWKLNRNVWVESVQEASEIEDGD